MYLWPCLEKRIQGWTENELLDLLVITYKLSRFDYYI